MTVKEILKNAIIFANKSELLAFNTFDGTSNISPSTAQQSDIDQFLRCFNLVYKEISACYFPLLHKETITFTDNKINTSSFAKNIINIKKISKNNKNIRYFVFPNYIFAEIDSAEVVYSFLPEDFELSDEPDLFGGRVIPQVLVYGVVREYFYLNGDYPEADMWNERFKFGIQNLMLNKTVARLPKRSFR